MTNKKNAGLLRTSRVARYYLVEESDTICTRVSAEFFESLGLDLTNTFTSHTEFFADFFECMHISSIETESHDDDLLLAWSEEVEHLIEIFFQYSEIGCLLRSEVFVILDEVTESRILLATDRGVEREDVLRDTHDLTYLAHVHLQFQSELFHEWLTSELLGEATECMVELVDRLYHVHWYTDRTSLISDRASDTLADPPCRIRGELEPTIWIELIYRTEESYIPFLDEIEESESASHILLRDRDDETEIGFCESLACILVSLLDEMTETDFFFCIDERKSTDLVEVHTDRVV